MRVPCLSRILWLAVGTVTPGLLVAQTPSDSSGGPIIPEQAAYDVAFYDLTLQVNPADSTIEGGLTLYADVVQPLEHLVIDLDTRLAVRRIMLHSPSGAAGEEVEAPFERRAGTIWVAMPDTRQPGEKLVVSISYGGKPRSLPEGSFSGFIWGETPDGLPWVTVNCETYGADLWWPVKDHPSDEPDSMAIRIKVPAGLTAAANGRLRSVSENADGSRTFDWFVSTPINNYAVSLNIAPYVELSSSYESVSGASVPIYFWVLAEYRDQAAAALPEFKDHMHHLEAIVGPYPFQADKYGIAQTNYLGMEHQTIIAYGAEFRNDAMAGVDWGFDALHQHELAHEWFGNAVTPPDFRDLWLNEGFATYAQVLYAESRLGPEKAAELLATFRSNLDHSQPIAPREPSTAGAAYGRDLYWKGAWVLHTLRSLIGDEAFFKLLRRWIYPSPEAEDVSEGCACRFASTDDFAALAERVSGRELDWFFEAYLRRRGVPRLVLHRTSDGLDLRWENLSGLPERISVELDVDGRRIVAQVGPQGATVPIPDAAEVKVDPRGRLLFETLEEGTGS
jgi:aminopeptidase N